MEGPEGTVTGAGRVVVGVDGSAHADAALRYAIGEAARRGASVEAVVAFEPPETWAFAYGVAVLPDAGERRRAVEDEARGWVQAVRDGLEDDQRAVPVAVHCHTGSAAGVLVAASEGAELLVVGHRGRGAVRSTLLGSVGLGCVLHAACPVTVVPAERAVEPAAGSAAAPGQRVRATPMPVGPLL